MCHIEFGAKRFIHLEGHKTLENLPSKGVKNLLVICPGFASDCVETLEEIDGVSLVFGNREKADLDQYLQKIQPNQLSSGLLQIEPVQHDAIREHANFSLSVADTDGDLTTILIPIGSLLLPEPTNEQTSTE